jgi:hypothetical protein
MPRAGATRCSHMTVSRSLHRCLDRGGYRAQRARPSAAGASAFSAVNGRSSSRCRSVRWDECARSGRNVESSGPCRDASPARHDEPRRRPVVLEIVVNWVAVRRGRYTAPGAFVMCEGSRSAGGGRGRVPAGAREVRKVEWRRRASRLCGHGTDDRCARMSGRDVKVWGWVGWPGGGGWGGVGVSLGWPCWRRSQRDVGCRLRRLMSDCSRSGRRVGRRSCVLRTRGVGGGSRRLCELARRALASVTVAACRTCSVAETRRVLYRAESSSASSGASLSNGHAGATASFGADRSRSERPFLSCGCMTVAGRRGYGASWAMRRAARTAFHALCSRRASGAATDR